MINVFAVSVLVLALVLGRTFCIGLDTRGLHFCVGLGTYMVLVLPGFGQHGLDNVVGRMRSNWLQLNPEKIRLLRCLSGQRQH